MSAIPTTPVAPPLLRDVFLDGLEVMVARDRQGATDGFFVAAKGGHNAESHNHNDVGHYVVYRDGKPLLVDAGVGVYSRKTFSPQRYEIWTMQSQYHNLPTINGFQQLPGGDYRAAAVAYVCSDAEATMALDIAKSYPPEAGVTSWRRQVTLVRGSEVRIDDAWKLTAVTGPLTLNLLTAATATLEAPGLIRLAARALPGDRASAAGAIVVPSGWEAVCEQVAIADELLGQTWGDHLTRIVLTCAKPCLTGTATVRIVGR